MAVSYFMMFQGGAADPAALAERFRSRYAPPLAALPGLQSMRLLVRAAYDDPFLKEEDGPALVAHLEFAGAADLERAAVSDTGPAAYEATHDLPGWSGEVRCQAMRSESFDVPGATGAPAPACYFVQYRRPADDEAAFVSYYRDNHPPLLAALPGVREVAIYTPLGRADAPSVPRGDLMLVNLVAFDTLAALNAALQSNARARLREDYANFPRFTGRVTHTAMRREAAIP